MYAYKGGGVAERWHDDKGEGGVGVSIPPKSDDVIYEQPLKEQKELKLASN